MSTGKSTAAADGIAPVAHVRVVDDSRSHDLRGIKVVWQRELIRFGQDRMRIVTSLVQPVLYLFVLGTGLSTLTKGSVEDLSYRKIIFPGVLAMSTMFTAMFSSISIVWDREFGFLREMLVAPVTRGSLVLGKAVGGGSVSVAQGLILIVFAPFVGVTLTPFRVLALVVALLLAISHSARRPIVYGPALPVTRPPAPSGTSCPLSRPMSWPRGLPSTRSQRRSTNSISCRHACASVAWSVTFRTPSKMMTRTTTRTNPRPCIR